MHLRMCMCEYVYVCFSTKLGHAIIPNNSKNAYFSVLNFDEHSTEIFEASAIARINYEQNKWRKQFDSFQPHFSFIRIYYWNQISWSFQRSKKSKKNFFSEKSKSKLARRKKSSSPKSLLHLHDITLRATKY